MSRSDGSARPPLPFDTDVREVRGILRPSMGEVDWSIEATLVDERGIHFIATCHCEGCIAHRAAALLEHADDAKWLDQWAKEDERERRAWHSETRSRNPKEKPA